MGQCGRGVVRGAGLRAFAVPVVNWVCVFEGKMRAPRYFRGRDKVIYRLLALLMVLTLALGIVLYPHVTSVLKPHPLARARRSISNTDVNPYGANLFLAQEVEEWKRERTLRMAKEAGIGWVKLHFPWEAIEPRRKGEFTDSVTKGSSWRKYDQIVELCEAYGLQIVARLDRPPDWTRQDNSYKERPPDDLADYGDFVYQFVRRYQGRIRYIQIWNEPNIFPEWGFRAVDPAGYVELLKVAYQRAKEADPNVCVLSAPLAITLGEPHPEPGKWRSMSDLQFLEGMYEAGAAPYFDILSVNAFGMDSAPDDPPNPEKLNFSRVLLQREIMERYGDAGKSVWFNEYGWNAAPEDFPSEKLVWDRVNEWLQADYTVRGIEMAREEWPWAGVFAIWYFRQVGSILPDSAEYYFRMVDVDFTPRPVYFAVQDATAGLGEAGIGYHEETSPAVDVLGEWRSVIAKDASGESYVVSSTPGDSISLTFEGGAVDLISQRHGSGGRLYVSLDGRAVSGLAVNEGGVSYVDLYSSMSRSQDRIPLLRNAGPGQHVLRLTVSKERHAASLGHECIVDAFEVLEKRLPAFPTMLVVVLGCGWLASALLLGWRLRHRRRRPGSTH